ncbi:MAG: phosphatase PAP2 family protein [Chloroflexi bacterium]|nr:phosphatase PAP2 family protein [Chloroflexota bacterium]
MNRAHHDRRSGLSWQAVASLSGIALFLVLSAVVQTGVLREADAGISLAARGYTVPPLDVAASVTAVLLSFEFSMAYAAIGTFVLWRSGAGAWSLAPFGFLALTAIELVLKILLSQPPTPSDLHRPFSYPLFTINLDGSYPSGHGIRSAYFTVLAAQLLAGRSRFRQAATLALGLVFGVLLASSRIHLGVHWTSDVVGGFLLGASAALVLGQAVQQRLAARVTI